MKRVLCMVLLLVAGVAAADELSDANKLLQEKSFDKALPIYTKLADAGNPEAQFRLGEMYWYGDGTAVDLAKATLWLRKAAAAGHKDAAEDLAALKAREGRSADIAYWTTTYKGEDLTSGQFACPAPAIPEKSTTNKDIAEVSAAISTWQACYNRFVANINAAMPAGKRIPDDIANMMTPHEMAAARDHLQEVYGGVIASAQQSASAILAKRDAWHAATQEYVVAQNNETKARAVEYQRMLELQEQQNRGVNKYSIPTPTARH